MAGDPANYGEQAFHYGDGDLDHYEFTYESILSSDDSSIGDSQSLTSSVTNTHEENGRTYHSYHAGSYHFPNDPQEAERMDFQFSVLKRALRSKNYLAPFSQKHPPKRVLDIGTGTGLWCLEIGDEFPQATVIGTDLSPCLMPQFAGPNVYFNVDDSSMEWDPSFVGIDYIHTRMTLGCWADMKRDIIKRAFEHLAPGGYLECQEMDPAIRCDDGTMPRNFALKRLFDLLVETARHSADRPLDIADRLARWFRDAGFIDVREEVISIPINGWPRDRFNKELGRSYMENLSVGLPAFSLGLLTRFKGMTEEEVQVKLVEARRQLRDESVHAYMKLHVVYGRKPPTSSRRSKS